MNPHYRNIQTSLLRFCSDFATEMTNFGYDLTKVNLDAKATPQEWPKQSFIGVSDAQYDFDERMIEVTLAFVISTVDDENLFKMDELINRLLNKLMVGSRIRIYDAVNGAPLGHLVAANGMRVGTILNTESQSAKPIFIRLISDQMLSGPD